MRNIALSILESAATRGPAPALRHRRDGEYEATSYADFAADIESMASALVGLGIAPGDRVGIFSPNLPAWFVADYGAMSVGAVTVPIYATSTASQAAAIIYDAGVRLLFVGTGAELEKALEILERCPNLEWLVTMEPGAGETGGRVRAYRELLAADPGDEARAEVTRRRAGATEDDLATIIYTSGTTGEPKGVMLRHRHFVNQFTTVDARFDVGPDDRSLCFLPLSHVYERTWSAYTFLKGAENTVLTNPRDVVDALAKVLPTVMVSAPRLYEKVNSAVMARVDAAPPLRRKLFHWAIRVGHEYWTTHHAGGQPGLGLRLRYGVADQLVLRKVRTLVGGPKNFLSSGGAALAQEVEEFFMSLGLLVCQGYGLTETAPMVTCNAPGAFKFGTVGRPIDGVEVRIADSGEIEVRGPNVFDGYWGKPETSAVVLEGGWFHTGDIGHLDADGYLVITDRIKDLIITSGGKNVAPQRIEALVGGDHYIDQLAVVGDKRKFIGAIVVPSFESLMEFAADRKLKFRDNEELIRLPEVVQLYKDRIKARGASLAPWEKIKRFTLVAREFSQQAGEITPTLKVRRKVITEKYRELIDRMYGAEPKETD